MSFRASARQAGRLIIVDAAGRMTLEDGRTQLRDLIHVHTGNGSVKFLLNLSAVEFIDSYGIGELARCYGVVRQRGGDLRLIGGSKKIRETLEITRLHMLFRVYGSEGEALKEFS